MRPLLLECRSCGELVLSANWPTLPGSTADVWTVPRRDAPTLARYGHWLWWVRVVPAQEHFSTALCDEGVTTLVSGRLSDADSYYQGDVRPTDYVLLMEHRHESKWWRFNK